MLQDRAGQSLWLRQVATNSSVQIAPATEVGYQGLIFSRDGNYLYYGVHIVQSPLTSVDFSLYQVPVLGGPTKKILEHLTCSGTASISFSPDGSRFSFKRYRTEVRESALFLANADGTGERLLFSRRGQYYIGTPAWSPNGQMLACEVIGTVWDYARVAVIQIADGREQTLTAQHFAPFGIARIEWLPDGSGLLLSAMVQSSPFAQLWYISYPEGSARKIINDLNNYVGVSLTAAPVRWSACSPTMFLISGSRRHQTTRAT